MVAQKSGIGNNRAFHRFPLVGEAQLKQRLNQPRCQQENQYTVGEAALRNWKHVPAIIAKHLTVPVVIRYPDVFLVEARRS